MPAGAQPRENGEVLFPIVQDDYYGYIDRTGTIRIKPQFSRAWGFRDGLAPVQRAINQPWGYINTKGEYVIEPRFGRAAEFSEGLAGVSLGTEGAPTSFDVIDTTGRVVFQQTIFDTEGFSEGLKVAYGENKKWGFVDRTGAMVIPAQFDSARSFSGGLAFVEVNGNWFHIDKTGARVGSLPEEAGESRDDLAPACDDNKCGYVDKAGKFVIPKRFDDVAKFSEGRAAVEVNGKWGVIDTGGNFVVKPRFKSVFKGESPIEEFSNGLARVNIKDGVRPNKEGYIDRTGKFVWEPTN
jgi:hypothetical protein